MTDKPWREWWVMADDYTNRALIRTDAEKYPDDVNGKPSDQWLHMIEHSAYIHEKSLRERAEAERDELARRHNDLFYKLTLQANTNMTLSNEILIYKDERNKAETQLAEARSIVEELACDTYIGPMYGGTHHSSDCRKCRVLAKLKEQK